MPRSLSRKALAPAALLLTLLGHSATASACDCDEATVTLPPFGADNVPTNTKIWVIGPSFGCSTPALRDSTNSVVATTASSIEPDARVLHPAAPLTPGEVYTVHCDEGDAFTSTFRVGDAEDTAAPTVPLAKAGETRRNSDGDSCGDFELVRIETLQNGDMLLMDIDGRADFDPDLLNGSVVDVFTDDAAFIGDNACERNWRFDTDGDATGVRFASMDIAGHFSGWSSPQSISPGCGCRLAAVPRGSWGSMLVLALAGAGLLRRRRGHRRGRHPDRDKSRAARR